MAFWRAGVFLIAALLAVVAGAADFYVDASRPDDEGSGRSWSTAKKYLQSGVDLATIGDVVWVTNGVYNAGGKYTNMWTRLVITQPIMVRSVNGPSVTFIVGNQDNGGTGPEAIRGVWIAAGVAATLSGFTVTNGATLSTGTVRQKDGGGIYCGRSNVPVITNCVVVGNKARDRAGGVLGGTIRDCTIIGNQSEFAGGAGAGSAVPSECMIYDSRIISNVATTTQSRVGGGGVRNTFVYRSTIASNHCVRAGGAAWGSTLYDCKIQKNTAGEGGGGVRECTVYRSTLTGNVAPVGGAAWDSTLIRCAFTGNRATSAVDGGGATHGGTVYNSLIVGNEAVFQGGGAYQSTLNNCTVAFNLAGSYGGGVYGGMMLNSIVSLNDGAFGYSNYYGAAAFDYSCTTPMPINGTGNLDANPGFTRVGTGGYGAAHIPGDYHLYFSPCDEQGLNQDWMQPGDFEGRDRDFDGFRRLQGLRVDMGCYELMPGSVLTVD